MSENYEIDELPEDIFRIKFQIIDQYQWKEFGIMPKFKTGTYKFSSFCG